MACHRRGCARRDPPATRFSHTGIDTIIVNTANGWAGVDVDEACRVVSVIELVTAAAGHTMARQRGDSDVRAGHDHRQHGRANGRRRCWAASTSTKLEV